MRDLRGLELLTGSWFTRRPPRCTIAAAWRQAHRIATGDAARLEPSGGTRDSAEPRARGDLVSSVTSVSSARILATAPQASVDRAKRLDAASAAWRSEAAERLFAEALEWKRRAKGDCDGCRALAEAGEPWKLCKPCKGWERRKIEAERRGDPTMPEPGAWHIARSVSIAEGATVKVASCGSAVVELEEQDGTGQRSVPIGCGHKGCQTCAGAARRKVERRLRKYMKQHDKLEARRKRRRALWTLTIRHSGEGREADLERMREAWRLFRARWHARFGFALTFVLAAEPHDDGRNWHFHVVVWVGWVKTRVLHDLWNGALIGGRRWSAMVNAVARLEARAAEAEARADDKRAALEAVPESRPSEIARRWGAWVSASRTASERRLEAEEAAAELSRNTPGNVDVKRKLDREKGGWSGYLAKYLTKLAKLWTLDDETASEVWHQTFRRRLTSTSGGFWDVLLEAPLRFLAVKRLRGFPDWCIGQLRPAYSSSRAPPDSA